MSRLIGGSGAMPVRPKRLHEVIDQRAAAQEGLNLTEQALLAAVDLVQAAKARGASLVDALELVRDMWETQGGGDS